MAIATLLIFDGKTRSAIWREHLMGGAGIGLVLGYLFSRNLNRAASSDLSLKRYFHTSIDTSEPCGLH